MIDAIAPKPGVFYLQPVAMGLLPRLRDRYSEARTFVVFQQTAVGLLDGFENRNDLVAHHPDRGIGNRNYQFAIVPFNRCQVNATFVGKIGGVEQYFIRDPHFHVLIN